MKVTSILKRYKNEKSGKKKKGISYKNMKNERKTILKNAKKEEKQKKEENKIKIKHYNKKKLEKKQK